MASPSRSHTETRTLHANVISLGIASSHKAPQQEARDSLAVLLADLQRLEEALRMTMPYLDRYGSAEERLQALAALHREKPQ